MTAVRPAAGLLNTFTEQDGLLFLNPAAFADAGARHVWQSRARFPRLPPLDVVLSKHFGGERNLEFRTEIFNVFNVANFANPIATLPNALPSAALAEANKVQPGQPGSTAAAGGAFGSLTSTVGRTVGLGTGRQVQFALRVNF